MKNKLTLITYLFFSLFSVRTLSDRIGPEITPHTLYKPTFFYSDGTSHTVGTCFAVNWMNYRLLITAHHLFGLAGGLDSQLKPEQIASAVSSVQLTDVISGEVSSSESYVMLGDANPTSFNFGAVKDIAVFQGTAGSGGLSLANVSPNRGDIVWMLAKSKDDSETKVSHVAEVIFANDKFVLYKFDDRNLNLRATSGAPIVNASGEVVAVNTAAIVIPYILKIGIGGPIHYLTQQLQAKLAQSKVER